MSGNYTEKQLKTLGGHHYTITPYVYKEILVRKIAILKPATLLAIAVMLISACANSSNTRDISANTLASQLGHNQMLILDVRSPQEYGTGHVPGAINIPHTAIKSHIKKLEGYENKAIVIYCKSGRRAGIAEQILNDAGFKQLRHLDGDMAGWQAGNYPIEK